MSQYRIIFGVGIVGVSGVDTLHCILAEALGNLGFQCDILVLGSQKNCQLNFPNNVSVHYINPPCIIRRISHPRGSHWSQYYVNFMQKKAWKYIRNNLPATLIAGHLRYLWMPQNPGLKQIGVVHADDMSNKLNAIKYAAQWDACIAVSEESRELIRREVPDTDSRTNTICNGVPIPLPPATRAPGPLRVLIAGRIVHQQKRILDLPPLLSMISPSNPIQLTVAGDGEDLPKLKLQIASTATPHSIEFAGKLSHRDTLQAMIKADVILSLSEYEGTPMALMEALARGCIPVVSTGCGGVLPLVESVFSDNLFNPGEIQHAASRISQLASVPDVLNTLQRKAYDGIRNSQHTAVKMASAYAEIINQAQTHSIA